MKSEQGDQTAPSIKLFVSTGTSMNSAYTFIRLNLASKLG